MSYLCRIVVSRAITDGPTPGTQRTDGKWEEVIGVPHAQVLYSGNADVQDVVDRQMRSEMGMSTDMANGVIFLEVEQAIKLIAPDDQCVITWPDRAVEQALVVEVRRLDGALLVQRLRQKVT